VAADIGAWGVDLGSTAVIHTDRTLEGWVEAASSDWQVLESLGKKRSEWTLSQSKEAGFALATWARLEGVAVEEWFCDYRLVLGEEITWDIEAEAAYRQAQLWGSSEETALVWAKDRWDETQQRVPTVFTALNRERLAMERAAHGIAGARELRSREIGITQGPRDDPATREDFLFAYPDGTYEDFLTYAAPAPAVGDPRRAVERCRSELRKLGDHGRTVERHIEAIVESFAVSDLKSMAGLRARVAGEMPGAKIAATEGRLQVDAGIRESLRLESARAAAARNRVEQMQIAGEIRWGPAGAGHPNTGRTSQDRALQMAEQHGRMVSRISAALEQRREQGGDAALWVASDELDQLTRGLALFAVEKELERYQARAAVQDRTDAGRVQTVPEASAGFEAPSPADLGYGM